VSAFAQHAARLAGAALLFASFIAGAADLLDIDVKLEDKRYHMRSEAWFDASEEDLYRVLTDYELFKKFTSAFVESNNVEPDEYGRPQFHTRMEGCVLWWCKSLVRDGYLLLTPPKLVVAITDPDASNFKYSLESWELKKDGDGTLMIYNFHMEPDFFVPPVLGPFMIKRSLKSGGVDAIDRIEALAQGKEPEL
jgi:hypothetical protein